MKNAMKTIWIAAASLLIASQAGANMKKVQAEMDAFQKPQVEALRNTLQNDAQLKGPYAQYLKDLKLVNNIKDPKQQKAYGIQINHKYQSIFDLAMKKAKLNPESIKIYAKKMEHKYSSKSLRMHIIPGLYLTYQLYAETLGEAEQPPAETELNFAAPFDFEHSRTSGGSASVNLETGYIFGSALGLYIGHLEGFAGVGQFIRVPWATQTVRVSARLPEVSVDLMALAALGASGASAKSIIDVQTEDGEECRKTKEHGTVIAPVVWYSQMEITDTVLVACEMTAPPANQDIVVHFQTGGEVTVGGLSGTFAHSSSKPEAVRVRLIE